MDFNILCTVHAANVDLKSFSDTFYREICDARLQPVLEALKVMKQCGVWIEITHLIIPTLNDTEEEIEALCRWIMEHLGHSTPLHLSRFFPNNQLNKLKPTPVETLLKAKTIAEDAGLKFVYVGNVRTREGESTRCPSCSTILISRNAYRIELNRLARGKCPECEAPIEGVWY